MDVLVSPFDSTNGPRTARVLGRSLEGIVLTLAVGLTDGVNGRKIEHVEPHT